jgi:hypothetical protein
VWFPPGEKHWHGACRRADDGHIAYDYSNVIGMGNI